MRIIKAWLIDAKILVVTKIKKKKLNPQNFYQDNTLKNKNPVVVIQGYLNNWEFVKHLVDDIFASGHPVYVVPELENNKIDIKSASKLVYSIIEKNKLKNAVIVGYSKGGLIGKYILMNLDKEKRIKGMVTVATPHHGTKLADLFRFIKSNEFYSKHEIIKNLNSDRRVNNQVITISAKHDNLIWHKEKGSMEESRENIIVNSYGHGGMIFDKKVRNEIISSIEKLSK